MFTKEKLQAYLDRNLIKVQQHPSADLFIYNYSAEAQYKQHWDEVTLACRGLILDGVGTVVARPFAKFFNIGEPAAGVLPKEPFEVFEKMDGSLGILYWLDGKAYIATRGSFNSEQALFATHLLHTKYKESIGRLDRSKTYLFEIIYPENRIVVDYGAERALVLLAVIDKATGQDVDLEDIGFPLARRYCNVEDLDALMKRKQDNKEGYVVRFESGLRYKIKLEEYVRLHRILTNISSLMIWANLKEKNAFSQFLEAVPDEFYKWVQQEEARLKAAYAVVEQQCKQDFKVLETRKATAAYFKTCAYPSVLFKMLDAKDYSEYIWQYLKPVYKTPFSNG